MEQTTVCGYQTMQPTWWGRNWKWVLPVGCLGSVAFMVLACGGIFAVVLGTLKSSWACSEGVELARHNKRVVEQLGEPIETGWMTSGSINVSGSSGNADISVPLQGPRNSGTLYVVAKKVAGQWQFERAVVEISGQGSRIDLLFDQPHEWR
jgi:hypothetical protein